MSVTRAAWRDRAVAALRHTESPGREAGLLLRHVLGIDAVELALRPNAAVPPDALERLEALLLRRQNGEPTAYLLEQREFYGRDFAVSPAVLIPRPETEHLVDEALARLPATALRFCDIGTGSGCLAVTLAAERPAWTGLAVDIADNALAVARANAGRLGVASRLDFCRADARDPSFAPGVFALIVSNPPYVSAAEYAALDPGVRDFEPRQALLCSQDGMETPLAVIRLAERALAPGGLLLMEHGAGQGAAARAACDAALWRDVSTGRDLAGLERFLIAIRR